MGVLTLAWYLILCFTHPNHVLSSVISYKLVFMSLPMPELVGPSGAGRASVPSGPMSFTLMIRGCMSFWLAGWRRNAVTWLAEGPAIGCLRT